MGSSRHEKKRKHEDEGDTREKDRDRRRRESRSKSRTRSASPPKEKRSRKKEKEREPSPAKNEDEFVESMSIEETNKMRAKLGLAPLESDTPKVRDMDDGSKMIVEDGFEFRHKAAISLTEKRRNQTIKEKIEMARQKRQVYEKVLKAKGLADSDSDDDAGDWVKKMRQKEEETKRAAEREKALNAMDEDFGVNDIIAEEQTKHERLKARKAGKTAQGKDSDQAGMMIGHSKEAFVGMRDQVLVLEDKSVLDEGDETLVNVNILDNERHKQNVELRKRKNLNRGFDEDLDEYGNPKNFGVLSKYDEGLDGAEREKFRLDGKGQFDLTQEEREEKIRRDLMMAGKQLVRLDDGPDQKITSDFYTPEEMVQFRRPKKGKKDKDKMRKRGGGKMLKADDLVPVEPAGSNLGSRNRRRRGEDEGGEAMETSDPAVKTEVPEDGTSNADGPVFKSDNSKWKRATKGAVDIDKLKKLAEQQESEDDSDEELQGYTDLAGVVLDDDAENELRSVLDKTRKIKQVQVKTEDTEQDAVAQRVHKLIQSHTVKMEVDDNGDVVDEKPVDDSVVLINSTMEYCRNIGENLTYGLAGNRTDMANVRVAVAAGSGTAVKEEEDSQLAKWKQDRFEKELRKRNKEKKEITSKGGWLDAGPSNELDSDDEMELQNAAKRKINSSDSEEEEDDNRGDHYENVLGNETEVTKGVGGMLKLARQKGYLTDPNAVKRTGQNLDHLKNKVRTQIASDKFDIEDKYAKKLDRLGTTGRGPIVAFPEKKDYHPDAVIEYVDEKGRVMDEKDSYRELSYKFHGRNPGKKQTEKHMRHRDKKEKLKQTNSSDTPLGTLTKQLRKQEQLQTPYLVLSVSGRGGDHSSLKKD